MAHRRLAIICFILFIAGSAGAMESSWYDNISVYGYLDARAEDYRISYDSSAIDDLVLGDVYIYWGSIGALFEPNDFISTRLSFVYYEGFADDDTSDNIAIDEAVVTLQFPWVVTPYFTIGHLYLPVGNYDSFTISDSTVYLMTFTWKTAMGFGAKMKWFNASFWMFNGLFEITDDAGDANDNIIDDWAIRIDGFPLAFQDKYELSLGGYYLVDCTETTLDIGNSAPGFDQGTMGYNDRVPLWGIYLKTVLPFTDIVGLGATAEYATTGQFDKDNYLDEAGDKTAITSMFAELAVLLFNQKLQVGGRYESIAGINWLRYQGLNDNSAFSDNFYNQYKTTDYWAASGFIGIDPIDMLHLAMQYRYGKDNEGNIDGLLSFQTKLVF